MKSFEELMQENVELQRQSEIFRVTALALKQQASELPEVDYSTVEWKKDDACQTSSSQGGNFILRSEEIQRTKQVLFDQTRQQHQDTDAPYVIANNRMEMQHTDAELKKIKAFLAKNGISASNPTISNRKRRMQQHDVLGIRLFEKNSSMCPATLGSKLQNDKECFAKCTIAKGVIVGQYIGYEVLDNEWKLLFRGTRTEKSHLTYSMSAPLSTGSSMIVDGYSHYRDSMDAADDSSFLLRINDGRVDLTHPPTMPDRLRINTRFVSVLCDGFPVILVETTRKIKKDEALWIDYGERYHELFNNFDNIHRRKQKVNEKTKRILMHVDLKEAKPTDLTLIDFDDVSLIPPRLNIGDVELEPLVRTVGPSVFECKHCAESFISAPSEFKRHSLEIHGNARPFECNQCDKTYTTNDNLRSHILRVHEKKINYLCRKCKRPFFGKTARRSHEKICKKSYYLFSCTEPDCDTSFKDQTKWTKHMNMVHNVGRPFRCNLCLTKDVCYPDKSKLNQHIRKAHENLREHKCTLCPMEFYLAAGLKNHQRVHDGKKPFECDHCGKRFTQYSSRRSHIQNIHLKIKKHQCGFCSKRFALKTDLKMHSVRVHNDHASARFECTICHKAFYRKDWYLKHTQKQHKGKQ